MKKKDITFIPVTEFSTVIRDSNIPELPVPNVASSHIPEWYAKSERWQNGKKTPTVNNYSAGAGVKQCIPFLDSMVSGYMITLWTDVQVTIESETSSFFNWLSVPDPISFRSKLSGTQIPRPAGHLEEPFAWVGQFGIKVPNGYSVLITHPLNRHDLPFTTTSGIIDSDQAYMAGNLPFFFKANWEGIIPAGTPIAQVIPFKRESWKSTPATNLDKKNATQQSWDARRVISGFYKKTMWQRKSYE